MEVPKNKIIRIKTKEEVLQKQQQKLAPMFNTNASPATQINPSVPPTPKPTTVVTNTSLADEFLKTLDEKELIAYNIAKSHLGLLFSLERSNCYLEWLENKSKAN